MTPSRTLAEGWILAGVVDGMSTIDLDEPVAGLPYVLRLALDLAHAGVRRIYVVWSAPRPAPALVDFAADPRLRGATLELVTAPPEGGDSDGVVVVRADRIYHRDVPGRVIAAWKQSTARLAKIAGDAHDAVLAADRPTARILATTAGRQGGMAAELARLAVARSLVTAPPPYLGFTAAVDDRHALRAAERQLVWSLRKSADGVAAKLLNRRISLPISRLLASTRIHPNHVTLFALVCALAGGLVVSRGGYLAGVIGMLLVELGSIIDGIDGELARLRFQFSRTGQWLDTVVDDIANVAYLLGVTTSLCAAGADWAVPFGLAAVGAFAITQTAQYVLIATVYRSGDLAAIPWAFQSSEFLSRRGNGLASWIALTAPKLLKRDFVVTACLVAAIAGRLDLILLGVGGGAFLFFIVFWIQALRQLARRRVSEPGRQTSGT